MTDEIIFVYNADSNLLSKIFDFGHKVISPKTYQCELCSLTHGKFGERALWKTFREEKNKRFKFMYKDEFSDKFNVSIEYPVILKKKQGKISILIDKDELSKMKSLNELMNKLNQLV